MGSIGRYDERRALPLAERTLLAAMRTWVIGLHFPQFRAADRIAGAFADLGAPTADTFLEGFMLALRHGAERTIGVECPCHGCVNPDERTLLDVLALAQHEQGFEATLLLRGMISPEAACIALDQAARLGTAIGRAGTTLALPERPALTQFCRPSSARQTAH